MTNLALNVAGQRVEPVTMQHVSALDKLVRMVKARKDKPFVPGEFDRFERELGSGCARSGGRRLRRSLGAPTSIPTRC